MRLASKSTTVNKFEAQGSYSYTWTDAPSDQGEGCGEVLTGCGDGYTATATHNDEPATTRYVNTNVAGGIIGESKGDTRARTNSSLNIVSKNTDTSESVRTMSGAMAEAQCQLDKSGIKPGCIIDTLSFSIEKKVDGLGEQMSLSTTIGGLSGTGATF